MPSYWASHPTPQIQRLEIEHSWGSQASRGLVQYVTAGSVETIPPIPEGSLLYLSTQYGHFFAGLAKSDNVVETSNGHNRTVEFEDLRCLLDWDLIYCRFNRPVKTWISGQRVKRYEHIYPLNFAAGQKTWTVLPLTPAEIMLLILRPVQNGGCPTVESPWISVWLGEAQLPILHAIQSTYACPVLDLDWEGIRLSQALTELCDRQGLTFTHAPTPTRPYRLWFARRGETALPVYAGGEASSANPELGAIFPPRCDNKSCGVTVSGNPSRILVLGDRNLYQVRNLTMEPNWNQNWNSLFDPTELEHQLYTYAVTPQAIGSIAAGTRFNAIPGDNDDHLQGAQLASAYAKTITVREYDALRRAGLGGLAYPVNSYGTGFIDNNLFNGRSRMDMPAWQYITTLLFRAFAPPAIINLPGGARATASLQLIGETLAQMTHDPANVGGEITVRSIDEAEGNGYAIIRGYCIGQDAFKTLTPETFQVQKWWDWKLLWQSVPFQVDDNGGNGGGFIIFDQPVIDVSSLVEFTGSGTGPNSETYVCFKANPMLTVPPVKAALTFAAERFNYIYPPSVTGQVRDAVENVPGLNAEVIVSGTGWTEIPYVDGQTASVKALAIAASLLNCQTVYWQGSFERKLISGDTGIGLMDSYNRRTVKIGPEGQTETVDFTSERHPSFTPERDFDRRRNMDRLLPGQAELRQQARQQVMIASGLRGNKEFAKTVHDSFHGYIGEGSDKLSPPGRFS